MFIWRAALLFFSWEVGRPNAYLIAYDQRHAASPRRQVCTVFEGMVGTSIYFFFVDVHIARDTDLVGFDLLVDVKETDLMHDRQLGNEIDDRHH